MQDRLRAEGVETLGIINTPLERARLYSRYRPTRLILLADPDAITHQAFGVPAVELIPTAAGGGPSLWPRKSTLEAVQAVHINPTGELPEPMNPFEASETLNRQDGFQLTEADEQTAAAHGTQLAGHFLIDRDGVIRWTHVEAEKEIADVCKFPTEAEFLAAARALPR